MSEKVIVGYQGIKNSNNYVAATHFLETHAWPDAELKPLVSGVNVVAALLSGEIQYGVYAYSTDVAGLVAENVAATKGVDLKIIDRYSIDIHHQFFKKSADVPDSAITSIVGHPEGIRECSGTIGKLYPHAQRVPSVNSAVAARELAEGVLPETAAVICSMEAGEQYGLTLLKENAEDLEHNGTTFVLVTL